MFAETFCVRDELRLRERRFVIFPTIMLEMTSTKSLIARTSPSQMDAPVMCGISTRNAEVIALIISCALRL